MHKQTNILKYLRMFVSKLIEVESDDYCLKYDPGERRDVGRFAALALFILSRNEGSETQRARHPLIFLHAAQNKAILI